MKNRYIQILTAIIGLLLYATVWAQTITVSDMAGRTVAVPIHPDRIICLGPGALRLIVYLHAEEKVVAVEDMEKRYPNGRPYWMAHPELSKLPRCGPGGTIAINKKPDLEAVLAVNPQIIFITYMDGPLADEVQNTLGIPVVVLDYGAFAAFDETVLKSLRLAGHILDCPARADQVISYIDTLCEELNQRTIRIPANQKPKVYVGGIGYRGEQGIGSSDNRFMPFDWVNALNVVEKFDSKVGSHVFLDKEQLLRLDPDIIFIDSSGLSLVAEDFRKKKTYYQTLKAVATCHFYTLLPFNWYTTNIDTALADAFAIGKAIYPESFKDIDPEKKADEIYTFMVGKPVYSEMKKSYGAIGQTVPFIKSTYQRRVNINERAKHTGK